jgi:hypothetical protein
MGDGGWQEGAKVQIGAELLCKGANVDDKNRWAETGDREPGSWWAGGARGITATLNPQPDTLIS